jgi:E3 ubiquitin-protein ligase DOA10
VSSCFTVLLAVWIRYSKKSSLNPLSNGLVGGVTAVIVIVVVVVVTVAVATATFSEASATSFLTLARSFSLFSANGTEYL